MGSVKTSYYVLVTVCCIVGASCLQYSLKKCKDSSACGPGYCCAMRVKNQVGFCMQNKQLGELCSYSYTKGYTFTCGCDTGLACAIVERDRITEKEKFRCVQIPPMVVEHLEKQGTSNRKNYKKKPLTAMELRRLLKLFRQRPRLSNFRHKHKKHSKEGSVPRLLERTR